MEPFYRATLRLERVEPYHDGDVALEHTTELAFITMTGDTPSDAMYQLCAHADSLHDWHQQQADDEAEPDAVFDEAVRLGPPLLDLSKIFQDILTPPKRHHCTICGRPGPIRHEGNSWICADCNATLDAQKTEAEQAGEHAPPSCGATTGNTWNQAVCGRAAGHGGAHRSGFSFWNDPEPSADETHDAYGTPITPPANLCRGCPDCIPSADGEPSGIHAEMAKPRAQGGIIPARMWPNLLTGQ